MPTRIALIALLSGCLYTAAVGSDPCEAVPLPPVGAWSPDFNLLGGDPDSDDCSDEGNSSCVCENAAPSCHALYLSRVDGYERNRATLSFKKLQPKPSCATFTWEVVEVDRLYPSCTSLDQWPARARGQWTEGEYELSVEVDVWPDDDAFDRAAAGDRVYLGLITGGAQREDERYWFTYQSVEFVKQCEDNGPAR